MLAKCEGEKDEAPTSEAQHQHQRFASYQKAAKINGSTHQISAQVIAVILSMQLKLTNLEPYFKWKILRSNTSSWMILLARVAQNPVVAESEVKDVGLSLEGSVAAELEVILTCCSCLKRSC